MNLAHRPLTQPAPQAPILPPPPASSQLAGRQVSVRWRRPADAPQRVAIIQQVLVEALRRQGRI